MNILQLSQTPLAGSPYNFHTCINKYTPHKSVLVQFKSRFENSHLFWGEDIIYSDKMKLDLNSFDVAVWHNCDYLNERLTPANLPYPSVFIAHDLKPKLKYNNWNYFYKKFVIAQYQMLHYPDFIPQIQPVDIYNHKYSPTKKWIDFLITSASKDGKDKGYAYKGYDVIINILRNKSLNCQIMVGLPHDVVTKARLESRCCFDDVIQDSYHLTTIESLACDCYVIGNVNQKIRDYFSPYTCSSWLCDSTKTIEDRIDYFLKNRDKAVSRQWLENNYNIEKISNDFINKLVKKD